MKPLSIGHAALLADISTCLNHYRLASPGVYCCIHVDIELSAGIRLTPGVTLMVNHGRLRTATPEPDYELFRGSPNFVADVFPSDADPEYRHRRQLFADASVHEYLAVFDTDPLTWNWHTTDVASYGLLAPDDDGTVRSRALPGLWLPTSALSARDWWAIMASIARGVTRRGHHDFMDTIWNTEKSG